MTTSLAHSDEELALRDAVRTYLADHAPVDAVRRLRDEPIGYDVAAWTAMGELGWTTLPYPEEIGGMSAGLATLGVVAGELGRTLTVTPLLSQLIAITVLTDHVSERAAALAADAIAGSAMPVLVGAGDVPLTAAERPISIELDPNGREVLRGGPTLVLDGDVATHMVVVAEHADDGPCLVLLERSVEGVDLRIGSLTDGRQVAAVELEAVIESRHYLTRGAVARTAVERGCRYGAAIATSEMVGAAAAALELTVSHLKSREQFGVTLASFQALQHRAARVLQVVELATASSRHSLCAIDHGSGDAELLVATALVQAKEALSLAAREGVQMHGGLGMTDEADIGLYLKRAQVSSSLFGDLSQHCARIAHLHGL